MDKSIAFPHLGIYLDNVGKSFQVFGIEIAYYGVIIAIGMVLGVWMGMYEAKRLGLDEDRVFNMVIIAIVAAMVGARLYFVAFKWDYYRAHPAEILNYRQGGLAIYGGVLSAVLAAYIYTRYKKMPFLKVADACCMGILIGQIIGRWGNFFNREAFGGYTDSLLAMRLPESAVRQSDITEELAAHMIDGYIQVHPTFLYESLWNLGVLAFLFFYRKHKKFDGELILLYFLGYGLGRGWIEGLRTDQLLLPVAKIPVSQLLSVCIVLACAVLLVIGYQRAKGLNKKKPEIRG